MGNLLHYAIVFLVIALVAALFGFGGVAGTAMEGARSDGLGSKIDEQIGDSITLLSRN